MGVRHALLPAIMAGDLRQIITSLAVVAVLLLIITYLLLGPRSAPLKGSASTAPQLLLPVGKVARSYFGRQFDFLADGFRSTSSSIFRFTLNQKEVIAVSGKEERVKYFQTKSLDLYQGFQVLIGTVC